MARFVFTLLLGTALGLCPICTAQTPHSLLWNSSSEDGQKALELMKNDPSWVHKKDTDRRTPLHVAARFNHVEVVEWLLENGADVNAQAYNKFTPLHLTETPEIVKLILEKKPNLVLESVSGTALQKALADLRPLLDISDRSDATNKRVDALEKIVAMYVEHLGDDIDIVSAIRLGQVNMVKKIVAENPSTAHGKQHGSSPLREAANWGQLEICKFLVEEHNVDVDDFKGGTGYPVIKAALRHPKIVKYLIDSGADLEKRITWRGGRSGIWIVGDNATVLHFAARDGVPETIKILLDAGVDPFATAHDFSDEEDKQTALEVAAFFCKTDNAISILEHPKFKEANPVIRQKALDDSVVVGSHSSWLAFHAQDRSELLDALISHGANVNTSKNDQSLIQIAVAGIHPDNDEKNKRIKKMVSVLAKHGVQIDAYSAVAIGDLKLLAKLLDENPNAVNSSSNPGLGVLYLAIKLDNPKAVKLLLAAGYDVETKNNSDTSGWAGETSLLAATFWRRIEIAELLIQAGANVNATTEKHVLPLHEAVRMEYPEMVKLLLKNGADAQAVDHTGRTPLEYASDPATVQEYKDLFLEFQDSKTKE